MAVVKIVQQDGFLFLLESGDSLLAEQEIFTKTFTFGGENLRPSATYFASGLISYNSTSANSLTIVYAINIANQEKLFMERRVMANGSGAGVLPERSEQAYKWTNASVQFDRYEFINASGETWDIGSNISALGTDGGESFYIIQTGTEFEETDTNKSYVWNGTVWVQL